LGGDRGLLVDFASPEAIAEAALCVLGAPELQAQLESRTRAYGQSLLWAEVGERYRELLREVFRQLPRPRPGPAVLIPVAAPVPPAVAGSAAQ
jgi:glycosyltransferase involved in cell wall biosynthesis